MDCKRMEELLALRLYDELPAEEREPVAAHLATCAPCAATARELEGMRELLKARPLLEPAPDLVVHCRAALEEALDRETTGWRALVASGFGLWSLGATFRVGTALAVLLVGFSLGWTLSRQGAVPTAPVSVASNGWFGADLSNMRINGISRVVPDPQTGEVHITLDAERRLTLEGPLDDPRIQQLLVYALRSYENPGIRHDTLEVLRARPSTPAVRDALLYVMLNDSNDGVRLEAVNAVQGLAWSAEVQSALLDTLQKDTNPGVRVAAINALLDHADEDVLPTLEKLAATDENPYVRLKCASKVRELTRSEF